MRAIALVEDGMCADKAGDDAAALDIAGQDHRYIRRAGEAHIGDVARAQIGLGRAAGALDQNDVGVAATDASKLSRTAAISRGLKRLIGRGRMAHRASALHDHLRVQHRSAA